MSDSILTAIDYARRMAVRLPRMELRVDGLKPFAAAFEAKYGPMVPDATAKGPSYAGIPIVEDPIVPPGMALVVQDGQVVQIIRYAPKDAPETQKPAALSS